MKILNFQLEPWHDEASDAAAAAAAAAAAGKGGDDKGGDGNKKPGADDKGKGGDDKSGEKKTVVEPGGKAGDDKTPKAPAKYALTLPDGDHLGADDLKRVEEAARAADLTNDEAQAWLAEQHGALEAQSQAWAAETKADKELGGDKLAETQKLGRQAIDRLFPEGDAHREGFLKFIKRGGAGNNIHVVRAFARIGKLMAEDTVVGGNGGGGGAKDTASVLYDKGAGDQKV